MSATRSSWDRRWRDLLKVGVVALGVLGCRTDSADRDAPAFARETGTTPLRMLVDLGLALRGASAEVRSLRRELRRRDLHVAARWDLRPSAPGPGIGEGEAGPAGATTWGYAEYLLVGFVTGAASELGSDNLLWHRVQTDASLPAENSWYEKPGPIGATVVIERSGVDVGTARIVEGRRIGPMSAEFLLEPMAVGVDAAVPPRTGDALRHVDNSWFRFPRPALETKAKVGEIVAVEAGAGWCLVSLGWGDGLAVGQELFAESRESRLEVVWTLRSVSICRVPEGSTVRIEVEKPITSRDPDF